MAGIVKMDDVGLWLSRKPGALAQGIGRFLLAAAPRLMKLLTVLGTAAMFLVGGGILVHGIAPLHHAIEGAGAAVAQGALGGLWQALTTNGLNGVAGIVAGAVVLGVVSVAQKLRKR